MTRKYLTRCWFCTSTDLVADERGVCCQSCGATYNIILKPGASPITLKRDYAFAPKGTGSWKSTSPSGVICRQIAKSRIDSVK